MQGLSEELHGFSTHQTQVNEIQFLLNVILTLYGEFKHNLRSERTLNVLTGVKLQSSSLLPRLQCTMRQSYITVGCEAAVVDVAVAAVVDVVVSRGYLINA